MREIRQSKCPVCGTYQSDSAIFSCEQCNFNFAFVKFFADDNRREHWLNIVKEYKEQQLKEDGNVAENYISICRDSVSFYSAKKKEVVTLFGDGRQPEQKMDVAKFVSNDNNSVVLHLDGSVEVYGDNSYGQCDIGKIKEATFIALSSTCVFVVDSDKNIQVFGSLPQKTKDVVKKWRKVEKLVVSDSLIVSIDSSKKIRVAELTDGLVSTIKNIEGWNNVKKICVYKDVCVALFEDGKIAMTPYNDSYNEIQTWKNISDIVFDGTYVAGLSLDGTIKLAGKCKSTILDAGRKEVGSWTDIVSICCSNYAFGGYDKKGRLHLTGKFGGKVEQLIEEWSENVHVE